MSRPTGSATDGDPRAVPPAPASAEAACTAEHERRVTDLLDANNRMRDERDTARADARRWQALTEAAGLALLERDEVIKELERALAQGVALFAAAR